MCRLYNKQQQQWEVERGNDCVEGRTSNFGINRRPEMHWLPANEAFQARSARAFQVSR